jgi:hypothetical protein
MNSKNFIAIVGLVLAIIVSTLGGPGCANIVPPEGGFRDTLAPVMVRSVPRDSTINFEGNRVALTFDEFVTVDNFQQNVIFSPVPRNAPTAIYKLNTISVRLRDTLEPNTTYTINFGDAIKDVNEGNVMKNFTYVFSTGPYIDSLTFSGNVVLAETGKIDSSLVVILHNNPEDSAVMKERPRYMAKLNGRGAFTFRNLPAGTFYLYALKDETRTLRYQQPKQLFAFADSPIVVTQNSSPKTLYAYQAAPATPPASTQGGSASDKRLKYQTTITGTSHDLLKKFSFQFEKPLRQFDSSKIRVATDTLFTPVTGYTWSLDTTRKKLTLNITWQESTLYHLIMEKDFATDTLGQQLLRGDTLSFTTMKPADYGKLSIRFRNLDFTRNPVLQFVQSDVVVNSFPLTAQTFTQDLFLPGEYELRILYDANKNGIWDPGQFFGKHIQPELVKPIERKVNVKENWENELEIAL